eukprot:GHVS01032716.1.p1 GENE.GHVS01032716.1~~GHVS01032716.1.p1  ORF type:complete len:122 (+),score=23.44 GHVS01032716.1:16-381(+)
MMFVIQPRNQIRGQHNINTILGGMVIIYNSHAENVDYYYSNNLHNRLDTVVLLWCYYYYRYYCLHLRLLLRQHLQQQAVVLTNRYQHFYDSVQHQMRLQQHHLLQLLQHNELYHRHDAHIM